MNDIRISWCKDGQELESYTRSVKDSNQASELLTFLATCIDQVLQQERRKALMTTLLIQGEHYNA